MTVLVDPPRWPAHGRLWSHLASDVSLEELHAFAARAGVSPRAFEGDHYDVPAELVDHVVALGAVPVTGRELLARLTAAGLRRPKRRGERVLASRAAVDWLPGGGRQLVDVLASPLGPPSGQVVGGWLLLTDPSGRVLLTDHEVPGPDLPGGLLAAGSGDPLVVVAERVRARMGDAGDALLPVLRPGGPTSAGYLRVRLVDPPGAGYRYPVPWAYCAVLTVTVPAGLAGDLGDVGRWATREQAHRALRDRDTWPLVDGLLRGQGSPPGPPRPLRPATGALA